MIKTVFIVSFLLFFGAIVTYFVNPNNIFAEYVVSSSNDLAKPLKPFVYSNNYVVTTKWKPNLSNKPSSIDINGKSGIVYNLTDEEVVFIKNPEYKGSIASMVKIMTAMVSIDQIDPEKLITISKKASEIEEDTMGILENEKYTLEQMLYGLLLPSGNDSAFALAEQIQSDNYMPFVDLMNKKGDEIGMKNTIFTNPSGLQEEDENQYSTLEDVLIMSKYAVTNYPLINKIAETKEYYIEQNENHHEQTLYNQNFMLEYPNVKGLKTGYTPEAGLCIVVYAVVNGKEVLAIVLNSDNRKADVTYMLDYAMGMIE